MKKLVLVSCLVLSFSALKAQQITGLVLNTNFNYEMISSSQYNFAFHTDFSFGYQGTCPALTTATFSIVDDTLVVKGFYDITGAWPQAGCSSFDTVVYNNAIPPTIHYIEMSTNVTGYNNTPPYVPSIITYENVYQHLFEINPLHTTAFTTAEKNKMYPNPTNGTFTVSDTSTYEKIIIYNTIGQNVKTIPKTASGTYDIDEIPAGIYNAVFLDVNNSRTGATKLIKK